MGVFSSIGFTIVAATFAGFAAGMGLDRWLGTSPLFMILLMLAGFLAAALNVYFRVRQNRKA
jgi:ATP synthase protein I